MEIVGQGARQRADQIPAPVLPELDVEDFDFEHVTGAGAFDRDRPGQNMTLQQPLTFRMNLGEFGRDVKPAPVRHRLRPAAEGVDRDLIAARDRQYRLEPGIKIAPVAGFWAGMQVMMGHEITFGRHRSRECAPDEAICRCCHRRVIA
jgi:hypothetical protein